MTEATGVVSFRALRGDWGWRVLKDWSRNLGDPTGRGDKPTVDREDITCVRPWSGVGQAHSSEEVPETGWSEGA